MGKPQLRGADRKGLEHPRILVSMMEPVHRGYWGTTVPICFSTDSILCAGRDNAWIFVLGFLTGHGLRYRAGGRVQSWEKKDLMLLCIGADILTLFPWHSPKQVM